MGNTIPRGFGFHPSDEDLLCCYLEKKNQGKDSEITDIIPVLNVCKHKPGDIPALIRKAVRETEWSEMAKSMEMRYFYSPRDFKNTNKTSGRSNRATKWGAWKITGKVQRIRAPGSKDVIGMKRILTFYEIGQGKSKRTDWVIHEYYQTQTDSGEQIGDFVLCCLKNKSGKSDDHGNSKDADLSGLDLEDADSYSMASTVAQAALALEGVVTKAQENLHQDQNMVVDDKLDDDEAEYGGCGSFKLSDFEDQDTPNSMLTEAEISELLKELECALQIPQGYEGNLEGSTANSCPVDKNGLSNCPEKQTETCNFSSDVDEMIEELHSEPGNRVSVFGVPQSPQLHQQQDYPPCILPSPMSTKRGNVSPTTDVHKDEFRKRKCPEDNNPSLAKKNKITTNEFASNTTCSYGIVAAYGTPEINQMYPLPGENPEVDSILSECGEQGDFPIGDNFMEWDDLSYPFGDINPSLVMFSDTNTGGGAAGSDRTTKPIQGSVNCISHIGALLQCS